LPEHVFNYTQAALDQVFQNMLLKHGDLLEPVLRKNLKSESSRKRIFQFFSKQTWANLGKMLWSAHYPQIERLWFDLLMRLGKSDQAQLNQYFYEYLLESASTGAQPVFQTLDFVEGLVRFIANADQIPLINMIQLLYAPSPTLSKPDSLEEHLPDLRQRIQKSVLATARQETVQQSSKTPLEESILVHNAGLIILAPYLPRYFSTLGMLEKQQFVDAAAAERGVQLLQYLASRQTTTPEHLLVLNKILCGLPIEQPLNLGIALSEEELNLSEQLLNSVLQNWKSMQQSSIKNLQGAFLLREGLLRETEEKWKLHVEKKAYDVLMRDLPWTISLIKLPWMPKRIEVEWKINF
jgi:Contractile injection system tape measure protein